MRPYEERLPPELSELSQATMMVIESVDARLERRHIYGGPFWYLDRRIFYLNYDKHRDQIYIGFCEGAFLDPNNEYLEGDGSEVRHYYVTSESALDNQELKALLRAAIDFVP